MTWFLLYLLLSGACLGPLPGLRGQARDEFQLPADKEIQELLQAIEAYQQARDQAPGFVDPAYLIASLERLESRLASDPAATEVYQLSVPLLYFRINQNARAVELLEEFVSFHPESVRAKLLLAFGYVREEQYLRAVQLAEEIASLDPGNAFASYLVGLGEMGQNRLSEARKNLEKALSLDPTFADAYFQLGLLYSKQPETLELAREPLQKALSLGYQKPEAHTTLGQVLIQQGKYEAAVTQFKQALEQDPNYRQAYYLLADTYRKSGSEEKAKQSLQQFADLQKAQSEQAAREGQGRSYYEQALKLLHSDQDRLEEAYQLFQKTIEIFPGMAAPYYRLAQIDYLEGRRKEALENIQKAIQLNPLDAEYHFIQARCLEKSNPEAAIQAIHRAISVKPDVADFHNLLANLFFTQGLLKEAILSYRKAIQLDPENAAFHLNLSTVLAQDGRQEESAREKQRYFRLLKSGTP